MMGSESDRYFFDTDKLWDRRTHVESKYHLPHYKFEVSLINQTPLNVWQTEISSEIPEQNFQILTRNDD